MPREKASVSTFHPGISLAILPLRDTYHPALCWSACCCIFCQVIKPCELLDIDYSVPPVDSQAIWPFPTYARRVGLEAGHSASNGRPLPPERCTELAPAASVQARA